MKNLFLNVLFALLLAGAPFGLPTAQAAPIQPTHAPRMSLIPAAAELGQQIQALVTGDENVEVEPQETFGTRALGLIITFFNVVTQQGSAFATNFADLPQLTAWLGQQLNDPVLYGRWVTIAQTLLIVVGGAFAAGWLAELLLLPMRRRIYRIQPETQAVRVGALFSSLFLGLVPVIVFVGGARALMNQGDPSKLVRDVVMSVV
ncbi:MAG: hypothetical protein HGA90_06300, partial [Alphaproteobacteria bacterium]|nr:hypothetical protein [Alphaproteobacteria bacterium]